MVAAMLGRARLFYLSSVAAIFRAVGRFFSDGNVVEPKNQPEFSLASEQASGQYNEADRLAVLHDYHILDTEPEELFDSLTRAIAKICDSPIALISFADAERQWFKSVIGLDFRQTAAGETFCDLVVQNPSRVFEIADARRDERFRDHPLVSGEPYLRFCAGKSLVSPDGYPIGALCVLDSRPKRLNEQQLQSLRSLSDIVVSVLEQRRNSISASLRAVVDQTLEHAVLLVAAHGDNPVVYANRGFETMTGYKSEEIVGCNCRFLQGPASDPKTVKILRETIESKGSCNVTLLNYRKDGAQFWNNISIYPVRDRRDNVRHFVSLQHDVTRHIQDSEQRARLGKLLDDVVLDILIVDADTLRIVFANRSARENLGYTTDEIADLRIEDLRADSTAAEVRAELARLETTGLSKLQLSGLHRRKDGSDYPCDISVQGYQLGDRTVYVLLVADKTERLAVENELRKSERRLAQAQRAANLGSWELDLGSGEMVWSAEMFRIYERDSKSFQPTMQALMQSVYPDDYDRVVKGYRDTFRTGEPLNITHRILTAKGRVKHISTRCGITRNARGEAARATATAQDVTERELLQSRLRENERRSNHAARLSTLGEMASGLAHELNQPLSAIAHYCDAASSIQRKHPDNADGKIAELLSGIEEQAQRAGNIIRGIRRFVSQSDERRVAIDITRLIDESLKLAASELLDKGVTLHLNTVDELPAVECHPIQIQQIFLNLIRNALDALESSDEREITITTGHTDAEVIVSVKDSGPGVDEKLQSTLFDPFRTTKQDGMGLGLSIARSLAEAHGGRLWLVRSAGSGAEFNFSLPRSA